MGVWGGGGEGWLLAGEGEGEGERVEDEDL